MSKTTFEGYVPSLKARHEANIVGGKAIQSKGGSIRYMLQGEYDGRKTLPKTVTRGDFESVYGFDAKEAESVLMADTVGSPSPADVQPPAPSDTPFPQEPSNENFSAEYTVEITGFTDGEPKRITGTEQELKDQLLDFHDIDSRLEMVDYYGFDEDDYEKAVKMLTEKWNEKSLKTICDNDDMLTLIETKEALGLFGKKDEEEKEESDEPKTKEYTVVLQEGDKLELTDLPGDDPEKNEEDKDESEENDEKAAETWRGLKTDKAPSFRHKETGEVRDYNTMMKIGMESNYDEIIKMNQEWEAIDADGNVVEFEAVQAKVTRIEDEKEEPEEESDEGLLTPKNLAIGGVLGLGALALTLGAEDEESDYWHDEGQYEMNAEGLYESSSVSGDVELGEQKRVMGRKDYDISTDYDGDLEMDEPDLDVPEVYEEYEDELIEAIKDDVDYAMPIEDGMTGSGSYDVDVEVELPVRVTGSVDFNWTSDLEDEDEHSDDDWNAEEVSEIEYDEYLDELGSDALGLYKDNPSHLFEKAYPIDYEVGMNDYESSLLADIQSGYTENSMMFDEDENLTPYGENVLKEMYDSMIDEALGIEWLADRHPPSELLKRGDPTAYRVGMSEYEDAFESESDAYAYAYSRGHIDGSKKPMEYKPIIRSKDEDKYRRIIQQKAEDFQNMTPSEFVPFDQMQEELGQMWDETTAPLADAHNYDYEPSNEPSNANFSAEDNIKRFKVGERYTHRYHHGHGFYDNEIMRRTDKTVWTSQVNPRTGKVDSPLLVSKHKIHVSQPFELDGEIVSGEESYGLGNHGYRVKAGQTTMTKYADTVGSPSPSGPSSVPEPAEATGSEPSNENFESQDTGNLKLIGGIGLVAAGLFALGKSDWVADMMNKYMK